MNKIIEASEAAAKAYSKWWLYTPDDFKSVYYAKLELLRDALRAEVARVEAELAALRAKVAEMEGREVPRGWKKVPVNPSRDMQFAVC